MTSEPLLTALVVLTDPTGPGPGGYTAASGPPSPPPGTETVRNWFLDRGFTVDPVVGIAFSISAPADLFHRVLGSEQGDLTARLDAELRPLVAAVAVGPPPDFGPGSPTLGG